MFFEGLLMVFSLRDNGSSLVAHGIEGAGGPSAEFSDKKKIMEMLLRIGQHDLIDEDVHMADPPGRIASGAFRSGHVCPR